MNDSEDKITAWFAKQSNAGAEDFPIGIGDDMAQVRVGGDGTVLITTDMLLDGVHFDLSRVSLEQVGYKTMAVSLSDCAAMATQPIAAVVSVAMPVEFGQKELKRLHAGIVRAGDKYNCALIGGDITSWKGAFAVSAAMLSRVCNNKPVKRSGARVGDVICVTGVLGGSLASGKHLVFEPRVAEAVKIAGMVKINAMIDISDGLSTDLNRICKAGNISAMIEADRLPVSDEAKKSENPINSALNDGEDFELLFTLSGKEYEKLIERWNESLAITKIGKIVEVGRSVIRMPDGREAELTPKGYDHFKI